MITLLKYFTWRSFKGFITPNVYKHTTNVVIYYNIEFSQIEKNDYHNIEVIKYYIKL